MPGSPQFRDRRVHIAMWSALFMLAAFQLFVFVEILVLDTRLRDLGLLADRDQLRPIVIQSAEVQAAAPAEDLVPPLAGCTAEDRGFFSFQCPKSSTTPTGWVIGEEPYVSCFGGPVPPECGPDRVFSCNRAECVCPVGRVECNGVCTIPYDPPCPAGTKADRCTGVCVPG